MRPLYVTGPVDCATFDTFAPAFLSEELAQADREKLDAHLAACPACTERLAREASFDRLLRVGLRREPVPDGLEARVRAGLGGVALAPARPAWRRPLTLAALAASIAVAALLLPAALRGWGGGAGRPVGLETLAREVTVVDLVCDQHAVPLGGQKTCRQPGHINALKLAEGRYWGIVASNDATRDLAENPAHRGRRIEVAGSFYPAIQSIAITSVRELEKADLYHVFGHGRVWRPAGAVTPGLDGLATLLDERRRMLAQARGDA